MKVSRQSFSSEVDLILISLCVASLTPSYPFTATHRTNLVTRNHRRAPRIRNRTGVWGKSRWRRIGLALAATQPLVMGRKSLKHRKSTAMRRATVIAVREGGIPLELNARGKCSNYTQMSRRFQVTHVSGLIWQRA